MAITTTVKINLPAAQLPEGVSNDTLTEADYIGKEEFTHVLSPASTYDNATLATAIGAIKTGIKSWVDGTLSVSLALDVDITTGEIVLTSIKRGWDNFEIEDLQNQYLASPDNFKVRGYFRWFNND